jgi:ribosome-binding factor A
MSNEQACPLITHYSSLITGKTMNRRIERVNALLVEEISDLLRREVKDPRVSAMVSVTNVDTSPDLRSAVVLVSIMGDEEEVQATMSALQHAAGFFRHEMAGRLRFRQVPQLTFRLDTSIAQGARILGLLKEIQDHGNENPE